jgi:uncharacterized protein
VSNIISGFDISIHGLEEKTYDYKFEGFDSFFKAFEQDTIEKGNFVTNIKLEKTSTLIRINLNIKANIELQCDRTLEYFTEVFDIEEKYIYKFGEKAEIVSEEMEVIPFGTTVINVSELLFEFIMLKIPMKKLLPKFRNEAYDEELDGVMVYVDKNIAKDTETTEVDPRWAALLKIKDLEK